MNSLSGEIPDITVYGGTFEAKGGDSQDSVGISTSGKLFVHGGTMNASGNSRGLVLYSGGGLTLYGGQVTATATGDNNYGISNNYATITVKGGTLTAQGTGTGGKAMESGIGTLAIGEGDYIYKFDEGTEGTSSSKMPLESQWEKQAYLQIAHKHEHSAAEETYSFNEYYHWQVCKTCEGHMNVKAHTPGGTCETCDARVSYAVTIGSMQNGSVMSEHASPRPVSAGTKVTLNIKPDAGYELNKLTVTTDTGNSVHLIKEDSGDYTFTMPAADVTVNAEFVQPGSVWYQITVNYTAGGTVMIGYDGWHPIENNGTYSVRSGDIPSVGLIPDEGYEIRNISIEDDIDAENFTGKLQYDEDGSCQAVKF